MDPTRTPALAPPPGITPNFDDPITKEHDVRGVVLFTIIFAGIFVLLRVYTGAFITRRLWWDDLLAVLALILGTAWSAIIVKISHQALGKHLWDVPISLALESAKTETALYAIYLPYMFCTKASVLVLYLHIFGTTSGRFRTVIFTILGLLAAYSMAGMLASIFNCTPREKRWKPELPGTCIHLLSLCITSCIVNVVLDITIYLLPMKRVWNLRLPVKQRIMLSMLFTAGAFVIIASGLRLKYYLDELRTTDVSWVAADGVIWAVIEATFGLICGCLPFMKPFLQHFFPRVVGPRSTEVSAYAYSGGSSGSNWERKGSNAQFTDSDLKKLEDGFITAPPEFEKALINDRPTVPAK